jgi:hypothetical protein
MALLDPARQRQVGIDPYTGAPPSPQVAPTGHTGPQTPTVGNQVRPPARRTLARNPLAKKPRGTQRRTRPGVVPHAGAPGAAAMPKSSLPSSPVGTSWATARQLGNGGYA